MKVFHEGKAITLRPKEFVAEGGEGAVYARGPLAFKIYQDPAKMIPLGKVRELSAIQDRRVIRPDGVLADAHGTPIGYTMRYVAGTHTLVQLYARGFKQRHAIGDDTILRLVDIIEEGLRAVHRAGVLAVDLNEMNLLVAGDFSDVYFIDVDSYATLTYPATALMESIRDRHAPKGAFTTATDWFAFAVVTFQLFTGIHPYKGKHPALKGLEERMLANASVFRPEVKIPSAAASVDVIPRSLRDWYRAVFEEALREPPPASHGNTRSAPLPVAAAPLPDDGLERIEIATLGPGALEVAVIGGRLVVLSASAVTVDGRRCETGGRVLAVGLERRGHVAALVAHDDGTHVLVDTETLEAGAVNVPVDAAARSDDFIFVRSHDVIYRVDAIDGGGGRTASLRPVAHVVPGACWLFPGVVVQSMLGATYASVLRRSGAYQVRLSELDGARVIDARSEKNVLGVLARRGGAFERWVFRFSPRFERYDAAMSEVSLAAGIELAVLDKGVAILRDDDGSLEIFPAAPGQAARRRVEASGAGQLELMARGDEVLGWEGARVWRLRLKSASHPHAGQHS